MIERVAERGVSVTLTDDARELLGNLGYDPAYGARPLRRVIQKQLIDRLALSLLKGEIRSGDDGDRRRIRGRADVRELARARARLSGVRDPAQPTARSARHGRIRADQCIRGTGAGSAGAPSAMPLASSGIQPNWRIRTCLIRSSGAPRPRPSP